MIVDEMQLAAARKWACPDICEPCWRRGACVLPKAASSDKPEDFSWVVRDGIQDQ